MGIKIDDICFEYERGTAMQVTALDHISAEIPDNQFIGLIGHTGSGKSTLVQTLNGLLKPTSGHIYYNGEDISGEKFDKKKLRADVGLVFQYPEHQLFEIDVLTDVMFGPRNLGLSDAEAKKRALEALESVHMPEKYYKSSPFDLSGGQKRRAAIAGVLAMRPKILRRTGALSRRRRATSGSLTVSFPVMRTAHGTPAICGTGSVPWKTAGVP